MRNPQRYQESAPAAAKKSAAFFLSTQAPLPPPPFPPSFHTMDAKLFAKATAYFSCGFILLPAGRDVVATGKAIMPGDERLLELMAPADSVVAPWLWGMWGLNHCALSYLKCRAVYHNDKSLMKFLWGTAVATTGYLIANEAAMAAKGASMMGFVVICSLQCLSLGYLAFM